MRSLRSRLTRIEQQSRRDDAVNRFQDYKLSQHICTLIVHEQPDMFRVRPEHTDPETYRHIQETLAWARGDFREAERLRDLNPSKHVPPPPGTPWEERMRLAHAALIATVRESGEQTERVQAAIRAATA